MNNIADIVFIYNTAADRCYIQESGQPLRELTVKGACEYQGLVNGT